MAEPPSSLFDSQRYYVTSTVISLLTLILIALHALFPTQGIDSTTAVFLVILIAPWLFPFVRKISLPGGGGVETRDIEKIEAVSGKVSEKRRLRIPSREQSLSAYPRTLSLDVLDEDPNLALASLRMNLEQSVRRVLRGVKDTPRNMRYSSLRAMVDYLHQREILSSELQEAIMSISNVGNRAIHQTDVDRATASRVIEASIPILDVLADIARSSMKTQGKRGEVRPLVLNGQTKRR
jgi:hypothetical protein